MMERVNQIIGHPLYRECYETILACERDREYCKHDMAHFLDVGRLAYIECLESCAVQTNDTAFPSVAVIYAAAVLHDIGKHKQYMQEIPHERASAAYAAEILRDIAFEESEKREILAAILAHRDGDAKGHFLSELIYRADKASRLCFSCAKEPSCNWNYEKKNMRIYR